MELFIIVPFGFLNANHSAMPDNPRAPVPNAKANADSAEAPDENFGSPLIPNQFLHPNQLLQHHHKNLENFQRIFV
jgi:hypothetical protein